MSREGEALWRCWFCGAKLIDPKTVPYMENGCLHKDKKRLSYQRCQTKREGLIACYSCVAAKNKRTVEGFRVMLVGRTPQGLLRRTLKNLHVELSKADTSDPETCQTVASIQDHLRSLEARFSPLPVIRFYGEAGTVPAYVNAHHRERELAAKFSGEETGHA